MKKQRIITLALLSFGIITCNHSALQAAEPATPPATEEQMKAVYGFAAQLPVSTEGYVSLNQLGKFWDDFTASKTWKSIRTNPLLSKELDEAIEKSSTDADFVKWRGIMGDAFGNEAFVAFAASAGVKSQPWLALVDEIRIEQMKASMGGSSPSNSQRATIAAIVPYLKTLEVPPMILGVKFNSQKAAFNAELEKAEMNLVGLPPGITYTTFELAPNQPFKSLVIEVGKLMPPMAQMQMKSMIAQVQPDPKLADEAFQGLLTRRIELAWGYVGDYFLVSIGTDHSQLKFVNYAESLLSRPEAAPAKKYAGKQIVSLSWSSPELLASSQRQFQLMGYYSKLQKQLGQAIPATNLSKLEADLRRLDEESKNIGSGKILPMLAVTYRENGLHSEVFGGFKSAAALAGVQFSGVPTPTTFVWMDGTSNTAESDLIRTWAEDFVSVAYSNFASIIVPTMSPQEQQQFGMFQELAVPKLIELYHISRDQFVKSLGQESAFALDLNGDIPNIPQQIPPPISAGGKMPRFAFLSDVKDRALLQKSWDSYLKLANDIKAMPPVAQSVPPGPLPSPQNEVVDGISLSFYSIPIPAGDLLPNVAVTDKTFVASTSRAYSLELSKAAVKAAPGTPSISLDARINFTAGFDFTAKWITLAGQYPDLFFKGNVSDAAEFKKNEPAILQLINSFRAYEGMNVRVFEEGGLPRVSSEIIFNEH